MTSRADYEAMISSLDFVANHEPATRWKSTCDALLAALSDAVARRKAILPAAPAVAFVSFVVFEVRSLDTRGWALLSVAVVGTVAFLMTPPNHFRGAMGLLVLVCLIGLSAIANLFAYWMLAFGLGAAIHLVLSWIFPALHFEDRIRRLLQYFGYVLPKETRWT